MNKRVIAVLLLAGGIIAFGFDSYVGSSSAPIAFTSPPENNETIQRNSPDNPASSGVSLVNPYQRWRKPPCQFDQIICDVGLLHEMIIMHEKCLDKRRINSLSAASKASIDQSEDKSCRLESRVQLISPDNTWPPADVMPQKVPGSYEVRGEPPVIYIYDVRLCAAIQVDGIDGPNVKCDTALKPEGR